MGTLQTMKTQIAAFHQGLFVKVKKIKIFSLKLYPDTPRYVKWTIPSLLYQTKRKIPFSIQIVNYCSKAW